MITQPLKRVAEIRFSGVDKKTVNGQIPVRLCNYTDVYYNDRITSDMPFMAASATSEHVDAFTLRAGDVLLTKDSETAADIGVSSYVAEDLPGVLCGYHLALVRPRHGILDARYLRWAIVSTHARQQLEVGASGVTRFGLRQDAVGGMVLPVPSFTEQRAIADYLDAETTRIDALMTAKESLRGLMSERRRAHIDWLLGQSGNSRPRADVPWLSKMPEDWPSVPLGLMTDVFSGSTPSTDRVTEGDVAWTTSGELDQGIIRRPTSYISAAVRDASGLRVAPAGSVVVGLVGQGRTRGLSATLGIDTTLNQNIAAIVPRDRRLDARYLALLLTLAYDDLRNGGRGGNQAALNSELLRSYRIPLASLTQQRRLIEIARVEREAEERAIDLQRRSIDLLLERRQALITAAVTGQLEIPGVAA